MVTALAAAVVGAAAGAAACYRWLTHRIRRDLYTVSSAIGHLGTGGTVVLADRRRVRHVNVVATAVNELSAALHAADTARADTERELRQRTQRDPLTSLANRPAFYQVLENVLTICPEPGTVAVLFIDLDRFKTVNDGLGHSVGDELLTAVADRLRSALDTRSILARFGGDEFVVVAHTLVHETAATYLARRLHSALLTPILIGPHRFTVTASIGIAINDTNSTAETMIQHADTAMYQAKHDGGHRTQEHTEQLRSDAATRLTTMLSLRHAITDNELRLVLQPIVDLGTSTIVGYEALVRWRHNGADINPSTLVAHATELDLTAALDHWVIDNVCAVAAHHCPARPHPGWLHLNITADSLERPDLPDQLDQIASNHNVALSTLCIEVPEVYFAAQPDAITATINELRRRGVRIALDDFGTGHSSLARLSDLPIDVVKIDQRFIHDLDRNPATRVVIEAVVALTRRLHLAVVAEGVETHTQRATLLAIGCHTAQGFLLGRPAPPHTPTIGIATTAPHHPHQGTTAGLRHTTLLRRRHNATPDRLTD